MILFFNLENQYRKQCFLVRDVEFYIREFFNEVI